MFHNCIIEMAEKDENILCNNCVSIYLLVGDYHMLTILFFGLLSSEYDGNISAAIGHFRYLSYT